MFTHQLFVILFVSSSEHDIQIRVRSVNITYYYYNRKHRSKQTDDFIAELAKYLENFRKLWLHLVSWYNKLNFIVELCWRHFNWNDFRIFWKSAEYDSKNRKLILSTSAMWLETCKSLTQKSDAKVLQRMSWIFSLLYSIDCLANAL